MKYYIAGNRGLVGTHYSALITNSAGDNSSTIDYNSYDQTVAAIAKHTPTHVVINAATVGGLQEDLDRSFDLMIKNLRIQNNLFESSALYNVERLLLQGSTCSYPVTTQQPYVEEQLMQGAPHEIYLPTAMPKLMGMYQCRASNAKRNTKWRTAINSNMFGPNDRIGEHAHVIGALMQKFVTAVREDLTEIEIWGSGDQSRDLIYIKDAVRAMDIILNNDVYDTVNIASGYEITIKELADLLKKISGFTGKLWYNSNRPEGIKKRSIDNSKLLELGWRPEYDLEHALTETYEWYIKQ